MRRLLLTGATGFVGTHIRRYLFARNDWWITGTTLPQFPAEPIDASRERIVALDLREAEAVMTLVEEAMPDAIIHLAAQSHVPTAYRDPWGTLENNIRSQVNLLESCVRLGISPRILVIGSGEEYGRAPEAELPLVEDHPLRPENPYSVSKVAQDVMGYQYFISYGLLVVRVRPFNHVGPGQSERFVVAAFASQVARIEAGLQEPVMRVGNLSPARDFTDVRDVVRAYEGLLLRGEAGEVYNVASGQARTIRSILDSLLAMTEVEIRVETDPDRYRPADVPIIYGSYRKLEAAIGWRPEIPFEQTLRDVLNEWRARVRETPAPSSEKGEA